MVNPHKKRIQPARIGTSIVYEALRDLAPRRVRAICRARTGRDAGQDRFHIVVDLAERDRVIDLETVLGKECLFVIGKRHVLVTAPSASLAFEHESRLDGYDRKVVGHNGCKGVSTYLFFEIAGEFEALNS